MRVIALVLVLFVEPAHVDRPLVNELEDREAICVEASIGDPDVDRWCPAVAHYFGERWTHWALHIIKCESRGNPDARNGSHHGLFQHTTRYWYGRAARAGWDGHDPWEPEANIAVSAWLLFKAGTSHWTCKARTP